jgi:hypothetical protein
MHTYTCPDIYTHPHTPTHTHTYTHTDALRELELKALQTYLSLMSVSTVILRG